MLVLAKEETTGISLFDTLPERIRKAAVNFPMDKLMEVRLRCGAPLTIVCTDGTFYISNMGKITNNHKHALTVTSEDIRRGLELITSSSLYAFEEEIRSGFVTLSGGHRVGISGDAVTINGKISHIRFVQSLNYRLAREVIGAADSVIDKIFDGISVKNTVILSPPMCGKTTMLRDIARQLSNAGKRVSIVDERSEIASLSGGRSPFDLGAGCDVLSGVKKSEGMLLMLRSMSPDVIITDEIGDDEDFEAIYEIKKRGVKIITSLHGKNDAPDVFDLVIRLGGIGVCSS